MSVIINTNSAATLAAANLSSSGVLLEKSLNRLSSGSKIVSPADDAGGLAVAMKLSATSRRQGAVSSSLGNSISYLQSQDGVLKVAGAVLTRISELKTLYADPTKNSTDLANYNAEFTQLKAQLTSLGNETFNGKALFGSTSLSVASTADAISSTISVGGADLLGGSGSAWSSIAMGVSDWNSTNVNITNDGSTVMFHGDGTFQTQQTNIQGGFTLSFNTNHAIWSGYANTTITAGGATLNLSALLSNGSAHSVVITDNGTLASISIDGGAATTMASLTTSGGGALQISATSTSIPNDLHLTGLTLTNTGTPGTNYASVSSSASLGSVSLATITSALQEVATHRATNGAQQSQLNFASEVLSINKANIEAATSRIVDVDVAAESTTLARYNILMQAGTSMLAQANQSAQIALKLIG